MLYVAIRRSTCVIQRSQHAEAAPAVASHGVAPRYDVDVAVSSRVAGAPGPSDLFLDQAFSRMTGARATSGNHVRLLHDGPENYPAWLEAIASAPTSIHFAAYIIHHDPSGPQFAAAPHA